MNKKSIIFLITFMFIVLSIMLSTEVNAVTEANLKIKLVDQNSNPVIGVEIEGTYLNSANEKIVTTSTDGIASMDKINLDADSNTASSGKDIQIDITIPTGYDYEGKSYAAQIDLSAALNEASTGR